MSAEHPRHPILNALYRRYMTDEDSATFVKSISQQYTLGTLERLTQHGSRVTRRAAVLSLGFLGGYESNPVLGRALRDIDRGVRLLADTGIRTIWCRIGNAAQRRQLRTIIRLNELRRHQEAIEKAGHLVRQAPWFAEAWNQRAIAYFNLNRLDESIRDCRQAIELNPYHFAAAAGIGQCHLKRNAPVAALESFRRAIELNPSLEGVRAQIDQLQRTLGGK